MSATQLLHVACAQGGGVMRPVLILSDLDNPDKGTRLLPARRVRCLKPGAKEKIEAG